MNKFRVLSDLHIDINKRFPFEIKKGKNDDVFTVICGDTSGDPKLTIDWVKKNITRGVLISGNHLPYCNAFDFNKFPEDNEQEIKLMSDLRKELADAFPSSGDVTYLDVETGVFSKVVDGILFVGSTTYTDMRISNDDWNKDGDIDINMRCSEYNMNDFNYGFTKKEYPLGPDSDPTYVKMTAADYAQWFSNAIKAMDEVLNINDNKDKPFPVVLITHHPLIKEFCYNSLYVDAGADIVKQKDYNWASYASDYEHWLISHKNIKCYCCGHVHAPFSRYRSFKIKRDDGSQILVVNNTRGYCRDFHDIEFNPNRFVNTETWNLEEDEIDTQYRSSSSHDLINKFFK